MEIETARILLSTMIATVPLVFSLCLIALFAFPKTGAGWIKSTKWFDFSLSIILILVLLSSLSVLLNYNSLISVDSIFKNEDFSMLLNGLLLSVACLVAMPIWLSFYLLIVRHVEKK